MSPTNHVCATRGAEFHVVLQSAFVRPGPDVSVAVTLDHGLHDASSFKKMPWGEMGREIEVGSDVTVHFATIVNESVGAIPVTSVVVNVIFFGVLSTTVPVTLMSKKDALAEVRHAVVEIVQPRPNRAGLRSARQIRSGGVQNCWPSKRRR